jgi:hypothetical protein
MHNSVWGYLIAIAIGLMSQFIKDAFPSLPWLGPALFYLALLIALLATLGIARERGWFGRFAAFVRSWRFQSPLVRTADAGASLAGTTPPARMPRPAGPVGPAPVLQGQPKHPPGDALAAAKQPRMVAHDANKLTQALRRLSDRLQESVRSHALLHYFRGWRANMIGLWPAAGEAAAGHLAQIRQKIAEARALFVANNDLASRIYVELGQSFRDDFAPFTNGYHDQERENFFVAFDHTITAFERHPSIDNDTLAAIMDKNKGATAYLERYIEFVGQRVSEIDRKIREIRASLT